MKTIKHLLIPVLVIAAILCVFASGAAADGVDSVFFFDYTSEEGIVYKPVPVRGELSVGKNDVTVNDGCLLFKAENAGYYAVTITEDPSETEKYAMFDLAQIGSGNKAQMVFSTNGPSTWINEIEGADGYSGIVFYIDKPGTYCSRFYNEDFVDGRHVAGEEFACSADVRFLGELVSAGFDKDPLYLGMDVANLWGDGSVTFTCGLTFSDGNTYQCGMAGWADKFEAGKRTIRFNISNGPDVKVSANFISLTQKIDKLTLPENYTPEIIYRFSALPYETYERIFSHPEYVEIHFKDGTVRKVDVRSDDFWLECSGGFTLGEEEHYIETAFISIDENEFVFRIFVDGVLFEEMPVKNTSSFISDLSVYFSGIGQLLHYLRFTGNIRGMIDNFTAVPALAGRLSKKFFVDYLSFILSNGISFI